MLQKNTVRRVINSVWNREDSSSAKELYLKEYVSHTPTGDLYRLEEFVDYLAGYRKAFPDLKFHVEDLFAERDKVVLRWVAQGTHKGEFQGIPSTGKPAEAEGITIFRLEEGKVVEDDGNWDRLGLLQQLGAVPEMERV